MESDVAAGRLEKILPGVAEISAKIYGVYPSRKFLSAKVRAFIDFFDGKVHEFMRHRQLAGIRVN